MIHLQGVSLKEPNVTGSEFYGVHYKKKVIGQLADT